MTYSITEEEREGWRKLVLNRPDRLNAFNDEMHDRLSRALDEAATDTQCRAVVLTGAGRGFCAGQDLNDRVASDMEEIDLGQTVERFYNPLIRKLRSLPKPIICAVNGVAAGGSASHLWGPLCTTFPGVHVSPEEDG